MKRFVAALASLCAATFTCHGGDWPVLKHYDGHSIDRIAMPVGGIGTGDISLGGNGQWRDVEIMNKPGIGFYGAPTPKEAPCFLIYVAEPSGAKHVRALTGPVALADYEGMQGSTAPDHGFPRFRTATFDAAYPFGVVHLEDPDVPVGVSVRAFNPFIPGDADASGIPIAVIRYRLENRTAGDLTVAVAGAMDNFIGMDGSVAEFNSFDRSIVPLGAKQNRNAFRRTPALAGIFMTSDSVDRGASAWGTIALTTPDAGEGTAVSYRTELDPKGWNANIADLWDDFADDGAFRDTTFTQKVNAPGAALALRFRLAPHATREVEFLLTWDFPNRKDWSDRETVGNYYAGLYADAWDVAEKTLPRLPALEEKTLDFVRLIAESDEPGVLKEAALFNASTLRSQTAFRARDGNLFCWEGVFNSTGSCYGNCTHVWNYEQTTPFLFGALARSMRETEYHWGLNDTTGLMSFRVALPLDKSRNWKVAAADGQMGTIMKVYREWQLSGDDAFLEDLWPLVKKALGFAWIPGGWDADRDGVMEGCQHNTMDIEYYGPNPEIEFWYLGALKAAAAMATHAGDTAFARTCRDLFARGSAWTDDHLFNGEYYRQIIMPVSDPSKIAAGTQAGYGAKNLADPDFQIGDGCLVDQLVGQAMASVCGLGALADPAHERKALASILKYNYMKSPGREFNNMRTYVLGDEPGLVLTAYPPGARKPKTPLSYGTEVWSGLEYTAAAGMLWEGMTAEALRTVTDVRSRYDGARRNPFNEVECGNHYARAMAAWSTLLAYSAFTYSAVEGHMAITSRPGRYFWSTGYAWGDALVRPGAAGGVTLNVSVHFGAVKLKTLTARGTGDLSLPAAVTLAEGSSREFAIAAH
ncbi:MAG TPA: GH116 family glycosyl-hydrolase [Bacteroidota bacterium]|nr:GH116 family glycosyl-hydrolase [Bacteroidota bacterium]